MLVLLLFFSLSFLLFSFLLYSEYYLCVLFVSHPPPRTVEPAVESSFGVEYVGMLHADGLIRLSTPWGERYNTRCC